MISKQSMPLVMTIVIITLIISIIGIARWSLRFCDDDRIISTSVTTEQIDDQGLNETERNVLEQLSNYISLQTKQLKKEYNTQTIYFNFLRIYLSSEGVNLSTDNAGEIEKLIQDGVGLVDLEKETDLHKMSYDGRKVAEHLLKQIYKLSGLNLLINAEGNIEEITDLSGNSIYKEQNTKEEAGFRFDALIITLVVIQAMFYVCFAVAKKNQLFKKGGDYDGLDEKGIA